MSIANYEPATNNFQLSVFFSIFGGLIPLSINTLAGENIGTYYLNESFSLEGFNSSYIIRDYKESINRLI